MSNLRWLIRRINHFLHVPACTVTANHAHKLFHVIFITDLTKDLFQ